MCATIFLRISLFLLLISFLFPLFQRISRRKVLPFVPFLPLFFSFFLLPGKWQNHAHSSFVVSKSFHNWGLWELEDRINFTRCCDVGINKQACLSLSLCVLCRPSSRIVCFSWELFSHFSSLDNRKSVKGIDRKHLTIDIPWNSLGRTEKWKNRGKGSEIIPVRGHGYVWLWSIRTGTDSIPLYANRETNIDEENALFFSLFSSGAKEEKRAGWDGQDGKERKDFRRWSSWSRRYYIEDILFYPLSQHGDGCLLKGNPLGPGRTGTWICCCVRPYI